MSALTIYECPIEGCPAFMGIDIDSTDGKGDMGWNPDGWPRCSTHARPMLPVRVFREEDVRKLWDACYDASGHHLAPEDFPAPGEWTR